MSQLALFKIPHLVLAGAAAGAVPLRAAAVRRSWPWTWPPAAAPCGTPAAPVKVENNEMSFIIGSQCFHLFKEASFFPRSSTQCIAILFPCIYSNRLKSKLQVVWMLQASSRNIMHQTFGPPLSRSLYILIHSFSFIRDSTVYSV